jgi:hypothetical protein
MDVGTVFGVEPDESIDYRLRLLARGGVVEVDERLAVDVLVQGRKIATDLVHI